MKILTTLTAVTTLLSGVFAGFEIAIKSQQDRQVEISSNSDTFLVSTNGFPYVRRTNSDHSSRAGLIRLVEFTDTMSPVESNSRCTVIDKTQFSKLIPDNFGVGTNQTVWHLSTVMTGGEECPSITVMMDTLTVSEPRVIYDKSFQPDETFVWYTVTGFPYKYNNSRLALVFNVESKDEPALNATMKKVTFGNTDYAMFWNYDQTINEKDAASVSIFNDKLYDKSFTSEKDEGKIDGEKAKSLYLAYDAVRPARLTFSWSMTKKLNENKKITSTSTSTTSTSQTSSATDVKDQDVSAGQITTFSTIVAILGFAILFFVN